MTDGERALFRFMQARHAVYETRKRGMPWPWTDDPILKAYRFCNVYRELDKQTVLIHDNWLKPNRDAPDLWFACVVARLINWWPSLEEIGAPPGVSGKWHPKWFVDALDARRAAGDKVFTGAYMVRADAVIGGTKAAYLAEYVLTPMWKDREHIRPRKGDTLAAFHARLKLYRDMGDFMAGQVVADAKHFTFPLQMAADLDTWATPGPGSLRGLNRVRGRAPTSSWTQHNSWFREFNALYTIIEPEVRRTRMPFLDGQNLQNCLCEFDKYERVRLGQGKPRSRYSPPPEH